MFERYARGIPADLSFSISLARAGQHVGFLELGVPERRAGLERLVEIDAQAVDDGVRQLLRIARGRAE